MIAKHLHGKIPTAGIVGGEIVWLQDKPRVEVLDPEKGLADKGIDRVKSGRK